jgi:hypothetical protein
MFIRHFSSLGKRLMVTLPRDRNARNYLARQNFWERFNFDEASIEGERLRRMTTSTSLNDIVDIPNTRWIGDEIEDQLQKVLVNCGAPLAAQTVARIVGELVDNFAQHSQKSLAAIALQYYPNPRQLRVGIGDCGQGIRASLGANPRYHRLLREPHRVAIVEAIKPGVTAKAEGGVGFTDIINGVNDLRGILHLCTGDAYLEIRSGRPTTTGPMAFDLPGVQVDLFVPAPRG